MTVWGGGCSILCSSFICVGNVRQLYCLEVMLGGLQVRNYSCAVGILINISSFLLSMFNININGN